MKQKEPEKDVEDERINTLTSHEKKLPEEHVLLG